MPLLYFQFKERNFAAYYLCGFLYSLYINTYVAIIILSSLMNQAP